MLGDQILYFFGNFLLFFRFIENRCFFMVQICLKISDNKSKNSKKKFQKNVEFGLQAYFNMEIMLSDSDRLFRL